MQAYWGWWEREKIIFLRELILAQVTEEAWLGVLVDSLPHSGGVDREPAIT